MEEQPVVKRQKARTESSKKSKSPWQSGVPSKVIEEIQPCQLKEQVTQFRSSTRLRKPNL